MATGVVKYWNGASGWIAQTNVSSSVTSQSKDCLFARADVSVDSPPNVIALGSSVVFTQDTDEPWLARSIAFA